MSMAAFFWRALFLLLVVALLLGGWLLAQSASWRADALAELADGADLVESSAGLVQVSIRGSGAPILVVHGAPGGYDQAVAIAEACGLEGASVIAPSRPGFLATPLGAEISPLQQADQLAALLESLEVGPVSVLGFSTGAPAAILLAQRHPESVERLVVVSGVTQRLKPLAAGENPPLPEAIGDHLTGDVGASLAAWALDHDRSRILDASLPLLLDATRTEYTQLRESILSNPKQWEIFESFVRSVLPLSPRELGTRMDLYQLRILEALPVKELQIPTLVVHGTADPFVSLAEARAFASALPNASFLQVEGGGHLVWLGPDGDRAGAAMRDFLGVSAALTELPQEPPVVEEAAVFIEE